MRNERSVPRPDDGRGAWVNPALDFNPRNPGSHNDVVVCILGYSRLRAAHICAYATNRSMTTKLRIVENKTDAFAIVRDAAENAARNLGFALDLPQLSPELWQKVLVVTELQMRMRSIKLPDGWREKLAGQIWRPPGADGTQSAAWLTGCKDQRRGPESITGAAVQRMEQGHHHASEASRT